MVLDQFFAFICRCDTPDVQISKKKTVEVKDDDGEYHEKEIEVQRSNTILTNPELLEKANPLLRHGVVKQDHLNLMVAEARFDKSKLQELIRFHANHEVASSLKPIDAELWSSGGGQFPDIKGHTPHFGVDLGWVKDIASFAAVWQIGSSEAEGKKPIYAVKVESYIAADTGRDLTAEPWAGWIRDGWLTVTDSEWTDIAAIHKDIKKYQKSYGCNTLAVDPNNARDFAQVCQEEYGIETFMFQQSHRNYNEPIKLLLRLLSEGRLKHGSNPVLAWAATNMILNENTAGLVMPDKKTSDEKIDPIVAVLMGLSECMFGEKQRPSVYEDRGPHTAGENERGEFVAEFDDLDPDTFNVKRIRFRHRN